VACLVLTFGWNRLSLCWKNALWLVCELLCIFAIHFVSPKATVMKRFFISVPFVLFFSFAVKAQTLLDKITMSACACIEAIPEEVGPEAYTLEAGFCILDAAEPYGKEIKDAWGLSVEKASDAEKIGSLIGENMAKVCPNTLLTMIGRMDSEVIEDAGNKEDDVAIGVVSKIVNEPFVIFKLENSRGELLSFYWLMPLKNGSNIDMNKDYEQLKGKKVKFSYEILQFFDPESHGYQPYKVITGVEVID